MRVRGGLKKDFAAYILELWQRIGYSPNSSDTVEESDDDINLQIGGQFTPVKLMSSPERFGGVCIKKFPKDVDHGELLEYLINEGVPEGLKEHIDIRNNGTVYIRQIENSLCITLVNKFHGKMFNTRKLFCNGIVTITPEKAADEDLTVSNLVNHTPIAKANDVPNEIPPVSADNEQSVPCQLPLNDIPNPLSPLASPSWPKFEFDDLARRHSISLINRTPPPGSLAEELLFPTDLTRRHSISTTPPGSPELQHLCPKNLNFQRKIMSSIEDIKETLSDFNSCVSSLSAVEGSDDEISPKKDKDLRKRKRKKSPKQKDQSKKVDLKPSPEKALVLTN